MAFAYNPKRILEILGPSAECVGNYSGEITAISSLGDAAPGDLSFLGNTKYRSEAETSRASVLLLPKDYERLPSENQLHIKLENPSYGLALICRDIERGLLPAPEPGVHSSAVVDPSAQVSGSATIGPLCSVGPGAVIGDGVVLQSHAVVGAYASIGAESVLFPRVVVADFCQIGLRNRLLPGCIIGSDGYGYEYFEGAHQRVPQIGNVVTEADVDIGSNTTVDRARFGSTLIGQGTKIDNQVQIAHNVKIGKLCLIVAQVGISGSTVLEDGVIVAGQAGIAGHLKIGAGAVIAGGSGVTRSLEAKEKVRGNPPEPIMLANRIALLQRRLPELFKRFDKLEKSVESSSKDSTS